MTALDSPGIAIDSREMRSIIADRHRRELLNLQADVTEVMASGDHERARFIKTVYEIFTLKHKCERAAFGLDAPSGDRRYQAAGELRRIEIVEVDASSLRPWGEG